MKARLLLIGAVLLSAGPCLAHEEQTRGGDRPRGQDVTCTGLIGGGPAVTAINGDVTVPDGKSCTLSFVDIKGSVRVGRNATLAVSAYAEPSAIGGDIEARNCNSVLLQGNVTVRGS